MTQPARSAAGGVAPAGGRGDGGAGGAAAVVAAALLGVWIAGVTVALQGLGWVAAQLLLLYGLDWPWWAWPAVSLLGAGLVAVPATLLAVIPRSGAVRATGRAWLVGATALAAFGTVRAVPAGEPELQLALLALAATALAVLWRRVRSAGPGAGTGPPATAPPATGPPGTGPGTTGPGGTGPWTTRSGAGGAAAGGFAVAGGLLVLLPWLWLGALGGALESLLALVAAAAIGWLAATVLDSGFWRWFAVSRARLVVVGGLAAGVALLLVAAGAGGGGVQLPLLVVLPPLGFAAAALAAPAAGPGGSDGGGRRPWPVAVLVGLAALGPLGFVDAEEVTLLLVSTRDVPFWAAVAAAGSLGLALLVGLAYLLGLLRPAAPPSGDPHRWTPYAAPAAPESDIASTGADLTRRWRRPVAVTVAVVAVVAAGGGYAGAGQPGLHGERLFVVMADQPDLSGLPSGTGQAGRDARARAVYRRLVAHARESQSGLRAELDRLGLGYTPYYLVNAVEVTGGPVVRAWLSRRADVGRVLRAQRLRPLPAPGPPLVAASGVTPGDPGWNVEMVRADRVWRELGVTGEGITVGSSDSGVDGGHPALAAGFRGGGDSWLDPWNHTTAPADRNGHGTHTLGSAVGRGGIGVAPGAQWTGCVNLDRGLGNPARYLDCLQFMLAPYPAGGDPWRDGRPARAPHVLTNSWGCPPIEGCDDGTLRPATAALRAAGIYVVVAAGNAGPRCGSIDDPPAPYPDVLTVGAVDRDARVTFFSSRGPAGGAGKPDLVAPGAGIVSAVPGGGYAALDGTSMATPHLAGVVALMWSANPALIGDPATTTRILRGTARPVPVEEPACGGAAALAGAGLVDAHAAVRAALAAG